MSYCMEEKTLTCAYCQGQGCDECAYQGYVVGYPCLVCAGFGCEDCMDGIAYFPLEYAEMTGEQLARVKGEFRAGDQPYIFKDNLLAAIQGCKNIANRKGEEVYVFQKTDSGEWDPIWQEEGQLETEEDEGEQATFSLSPFQARCLHLVLTLVPGKTARVLRGILKRLYMI